MTRGRYLSLQNVGALVLWAAALIMLAQPSIAIAGNVLVFSEVPVGADFSSIITLLNTDFSLSVTGTLTFYNPDGSLRTVATAERGSNSQFAITIPASGTVILTTLTGGTLTGGIAKFVSDFPASGVVRFTFTGGQVGVADSPGAQFATLVLNTANGNDTGIALSNVGAAPINMTLVNVDANGNILETINPPELNPLPVNGQVAKFITQFSQFTQVANRSSGSIQILTNGAGSFNAFALLLRNGQLSSTVVSFGAAGHVTPKQFQGSFTGPWNDTTFGTTGTVAASVGFAESTQALFFRMTMTGNVFGSPNPAPTLLYGTVTGNTVTFSGNSDLFGPVTMIVRADTTYTFTANSVPSPNVSAFVMNGVMHNDRITGNYTVTLKIGGTAVGTIVLDHTNN